MQASTGGTPAPTFTQPTQGIQAFAASEPTTSWNTRPPVFIILELVEAGAGWGQQNNVSFFGGRSGVLHRRCESFRVVNFLVSVLFLKHL